MQNNVLISKIRCSSPNKVGTRTRNLNHLLYIATRNGVDLTPLKNEMSKAETYLRYIHERPRSHGLFGNLPIEKTENLQQLSSDMYQISKVTPVYRGIISLDERDAKSLGYTNKEQWQLYLKRAMPELTNALGIPIQSLNWVGAVHMEQGHPHVHCMFWRTDGKPQQSYIHVSKQHECRELLSGIMFKAEKDNEVIARTASRDSIISFGKKIVGEEMRLLKKITPGVAEPLKIPSNPTPQQLSALSKEMLQLFEDLPKSGRLNYQFLPPASKQQVDKIVALLMKHKDIKQSFNSYQQHTINISKSFSASKQHAAVNQQKAGEDLNKRLGNIVLKSVKELIKEYSALGNSIDLLLNKNPSEDIYAGESEKLSPKDDKIYEHYIEHPDLDEHPELDEHPIACPAATPAATVEQPLHLEWSTKYKAAMNYLYAEESEPEKAYQLLVDDAKTGNVLSICELGKFYENGIGTAIDLIASETYYKKALDAFKQLYKEDPESKFSDYIAYRVGKLYHFEKGCDVNYDTAKEWYLAAGTNKFAQYSLAKIYLDDLAKDPNSTTKYDIPQLFFESSNGGNTFATYELAKLYDKGYIVDANEEFAHKLYAKTIAAHEATIERQPDGQNEHIAFTLGTLYEKGKGTNIDLEKALYYYEIASKANNPYALFSIANINISLKNYELAAEAIDKLLSQEDSLNDSMLYNLGKLYADKESPFFDIIKAINYFEKSEVQGNQFAQYALGKIYADTDSELLDITKAINYFEKSEVQGNQFAQYALGKIYANADSELLDIAKAIMYFEKSEVQGNQFAQYSLGKIYSDRDSKLYSVTKAIMYFEKSEIQGNQFAQYSLGKIYADADSKLYDVTKAINYFEKSANQDNSFAQLKLACIYLYGKGVPADKELGMEWLNKSIDLGNEYASLILKTYNAFIAEQMLCSSFKLFYGGFASMEAERQRLASLENDRAYRTVSKKAQKEESRKDPNKNTP